MPIIFKIVKIFSLKFSFCLNILESFVLQERIKDISKSNFLMLTLSLVFLEDLSG